MAKPSLFYLVAGEARPGANKKVSEARECQEPPPLLKTSPSRNEIPPFGVRGKRGRLGFASCGVGVVLRSRAAKLSFAKRGGGGALARIKIKHS